MPSQTQPDGVPGLWRVTLRCLLGFLLLSQLYKSRDQVERHRFSQWELKIAFPRSMPWKLDLDAVPRSDGQQFLDLPLRGALSIQPVYRPSTFTPKNRGAIHAE